MKRFLFVCCLFTVSVFSRENVILFPPNHNAVELFSKGNHPNPTVYVWAEIAKRLKEKDINVVTTEARRIYKNITSPIINDPEVKWFVFHNAFPQRMQLLADLPKEKTVLWIWEPPTVAPRAYSKNLHKNFKKIFTFDDRLVDGNTYFKFYYPHNFPMINDVCDFNQKKFLCLINAKKSAKKSALLGRDIEDYYAERKRVIAFYEKEHPGDLHLYGRGWHGHNAWKGGVKDKIKTIRNYKFCICYENTDVPGYVTEKIFDCFQAGVVPVYLGARNVTETIPAKCFVDRRQFESDEEVYQFLKAMDEETYDAYLNNIREYLASEQAYVYTPEYFMESFIKWVTDET